MLRRLHIDAVHPGEIALSDREAHHARDVLRLVSGTRVEVFDDAGGVAEAELLVEPARVVAKIVAVSTPDKVGPAIVVASAIPKAARADWLIEKLSEIGVDTFIPLATARAVVVPEGKNKFDRWARLAAEASKQSRRPGVMKIEALMPLDAAMRWALERGTAWHLSTAAGSEPIGRRLATCAEIAAVTLFIGPEGGWTDDEIAQFAAGRIEAAGLTRTVLRVETAAVAAAAVVATFFAGRG